MESNTIEEYKPGLHIISEFKSLNAELLKDVNLIKSVFDKLLLEHQLNKLGEVYYQFPESGYTAVICLTESHISIHTWPEFNKVTFDVFLSNYQKYNNDTALKIHQTILDALKAETIHTTQIER